MGNDGKYNNTACGMNRPVIEYDKLFLWVFQNCKGSPILCL